MKTSLLVPEGGSAGLLGGLLCGNLKTAYVMYVYRTEHIWALRFSGT